MYETKRYAKKFKKRETNIETQPNTQALNHLQQNLSNYIKNFGFYC